MKLRAAHVQVRPGRVDDLQTILKIRAALPMPRSAQTTDGGFLLGSPPEQYLGYLQNNLVWILQVQGEAVAFCVAFPDHLLRASEFWQRRAQIRWIRPEEASQIEGQRIAYLDQLAAIPSPKTRFWTIALALRVLDELFAGNDAFAGHDLCVTTTVLEPVCNRAAWNFLDRAGAKRLGDLDEHYPVVGDIRSAIFCIDKREARDTLEPLRRRFFDYDRE